MYIVTIEGTETNVQFDHVPDSEELKHALLAILEQSEEFVQYKNWDSSNKESFKFVCKGFFSVFNPNVITTKSLITKNIKAKLLFSKGEKQKNFKFNVLEQEIHCL
jgi:hypothetical protein